MLFLQIVFVLIGVFASIGRGQLNISDAQFAVILTHSPTCAYCVLLVLPRLFMKMLPRRARGALDNLKLPPTDFAPAWNRLMTELNCKSVADGLLAAVILLLSLGLNISVQSNGLTQLYWTESSSASQIPSTTGTGIFHRCLLLGGISVPIYECALARHKELRRRPLRRLACEAKDFFPGDRELMCI